jgi:hypothetical protein
MEDAAFRNPMQPIAVLKDVDVYQRVAPSIGSRSATAPPIAAVAMSASSLRSSATRADSGPVERRLNSS